MFGFLKNMNLKKLVLWLTIVGLISLVIGSIIGVITFDIEDFRAQVEKKVIIGGDVDEGGCLVGAGYSWCEPKQKCLRVWEEPCE